MAKEFIVRVSRDELDDLKNLLAYSKAALKGNDRRVLTEIEYRVNEGSRFSSFGKYQALLTGRQATLLESILSAVDSNIQVREVR